MLAWIMNLDFAASGSTAVAVANKRKSLLLLKLASIAFFILWGL